MNTQNLCNSILPVWQPQGYSTYRITMDIANKYGVKTTHTGVLDPMAQGVIVILTGEQRYQKFMKTDSIKGYEFELAFGIATDSYDGMGFITKFNLAKQLTKHNIDTALFNINRINYIQKVPLYSAQKVGGKRLFMYPKLGLPAPELPFKKGEIYKLELKELKEVLLLPLVIEMIDKVKNVKLGDFRQDKILECWEAFIKTLNPTTLIKVGKFYAETSKGLYIRSLSQDIANASQTIGFVSSLIRVKNGDFTKANCYKLTDLL